MTEMEMILGFFPMDNPEGRWFTSKNKNSFVRYYDNGFREICHNHNGEWKVSLARGEHEFSLGTVGWPTAKQAKWWADNRNMDELYYIDCVVEKWRERDNNVSLQGQY